MVDLQFQTLSEKLDNYIDQMENVNFTNLKNYNNRDNNIEITSISLLKYLSDNFKSDNLKQTFDSRDEIIIQEIKNMGFQTINQFDSALKKVDYENIIEYINKTQDFQLSFKGLVRVMLLLIDADKYF